MLEPPSLPPEIAVERLLVLLAERDAVIVEVTAQVAALQARLGHNPRNSSRPVAVQITEVIKGYAPGASLTIEELGWHEGFPTTDDSAVWARPGDVMLAGLKLTSNGAGPGGPRYVLTSAQTRFFLRDERVATNFRTEEAARPFAPTAATGTAAQLLANVRALAG